MSDSESSKRERPKPPAPEYDRFGFQKSFKRPNQLMRPWAQTDGRNQDDGSKPALIQSSKG